MQRNILLWLKFNYEIWLGSQWQKHESIRSIWETIKWTLFILDIENKEAEEFVSWKKNKILNIFISEYILEFVTSLL